MYLTCANQFLTISLLARNHKILPSNPVPNTAFHQAGRQSNTSTTPPPQAATFPNFPELPAELRQLIWKAALPSSRVILLEHKERYFDNDPSRFIPRIDRIGFRSDAPAPSILLSCSEAYNVACLYYKKAFTNKTGTSIPEVYFDFANDFLYLGPEWVGPSEPGRSYPHRITYVLANELHSSDLSRVENLAVWYKDSDWGQTYRLEQYLADILCHFGNVKHITLVCKIYRAWGHVRRHCRDAELKLLEGTEEPGTDVSVHEFPLPGLSAYITQTPVDLKVLRTLSSKSGGHPDSPKAWAVPSVRYSMVVTPEGEEHLLRLVEDMKKYPSDSEVELEWIDEGIGGSFALRT
jgi:2EXR family